MSLEAKLRNEIEKLTINKQEEMLNTLCNSALETLVEGQTRLHSLSFRCVLTDDCLEKFVEYCPGLHANLF